MSKPSRRTLESALDLPTTHRRFIAGDGNGHLKGEEREVTWEHRNEENDFESGRGSGSEPTPVPVEANGATGGYSEPRAEGHRHPAERRSAPYGYVRPEAVGRRVLVPLTTRLTLETADALRRAGLENRIHGLAPATVQEIVEEAITQWLDRAET
jgi:hypothetical protein